MKFSNKVIVGILIVLSGIALLSNNLGIYEFDIDIIPTAVSVFLMLLGLKIIFDRNGLFGVIFGLAVGLVGFNMFNEEFKLINFNIDIWDIIFPTLVILIGLKLIFNFKSSSRLAIFSGVEIGENSWKLKDDGYTALMGGIDIDLTKAEIPDGITELNLTAVMGGIEVLVPNNVNIVCEGKIVLGGIEFFSKSSGGIISNVKKEYNSNSEKTIKINCDVVMGGIEIKASHPYNAK